MEVDSAEHMAAIVKLLKEAGYSFSSTSPMVFTGAFLLPSGRVDIIDCGGPQTCEESQK